MRRTQARLSVVTTCIDAVDHPIPAAWVPLEGRTRENRRGTQTSLCTRKAGRTMCRKQDEAYAQTLLRIAEADAETAIQSNVDSTKNRRAVALWMADELQREATRRDLADAIPQAPSATASRPRCPGPDLTRLESTLVPPKAGIAKNRQGPRTPPLRRPRGVHFACSCCEDPCADAHTGTNKAPSAGGCRGGNRSLIRCCRCPRQPCAGSRSHDG